MKIHVLIILLTTSLFLPAALSGPDIRVGQQYTLAIPTEYADGFVGRAFLMETEQSPPHFRAAISVEAAAGKFSCSVDVFLGDVRVWSSGHLSRFYAEEKCVVEMDGNGELRLEGGNGRVGWKSGTSGQGVKRLTLLRTGNLVLVDDLNLIKWQSFNFPTDIMLWGQRLSSQTRLTSFPANSTLFYSMEIQDDKIQLFLNFGTWKYSYWEHQLSSKKNITYVQLTSTGLDIFNGKSRFDRIRSARPEPVRFLTLENTTGNLRLYHYSDVKGKFEASYQAINLTCDLPLACAAPYAICAPPGSCSRVDGRFEPGCGGEMMELRGVVSVLKSGVYRESVGKEGCVRACLDDCDCVAAQYGGGDLGGCLLYRVAMGIKKVEGGSGVRYMVKVRKGVNDGGGKNSGLKKWVIVVVGVGDGLIIFVVLGGLVYYVVWKRRKNLSNRGRST